MTTLFQARPYGRPVEITNNIRRKKLHRMDQSFIFLEAVLAIDSVRASTQFRRKRESLHLQLRYFFKNRFIHFHISSVRVIRPFERNKLSFFKHWNQQIFSCTSLKCIAGQIQVQKPTVAVSINQMPDHT